MITDADIICEVLYRGRKALEAEIKRFRDTYFPKVKLKCDTSATSATEKPTGS